MPYQAMLCRLLLLAICAAGGCTAPAAKKSPSDAFADTPQPGADAVTAGSATPLSSGALAGLASTSLLAQKTPGTAAPDPQVLSDVLNELATLGPIQPEAQKRLIDDLRKTDPAYWPMLMQTFRASLAYRRRAAEREAQARQASETASDPSPDALAHTTDSDEAIAAMPPSAVTERVSFTAPADQSASPDTTSSAANKPSATNNTIAPAAAAVPPSRPQSQGAWQQQLSATIAELEQASRDHPQAAEALDSQIYLRLLDLVAGRTDDALRPIPGLSPGEQDYWAKQLFALSTYLDRQRIADPARRASEASLHLSKAAVALGEQGSLVVRNLTFCRRVDSYGVLTRFEGTELKPAERILLYAEFENFRSEQTADGYHTLLEASYQILDARGARVARDDLPLTEEHCQNRRRDFFASYLIVLPKTIYEGAYKLELTIEDKLAHKIGQSSIEFTVKEKRP